jgi:thiamine-monophosphate kinase
VQELPLLAHVAKIALQPPGVLIGPGDDCALIRTDASTLITVDQVIEGRHFETLGLDPSRDVLDVVARKAIARSFSDIAAMAGVPTYAIATAAFPQGFSQPAAEFLATRLHAWGEQLVPNFPVPIVGGDIAATSGPLVLTVTMLGSPHPHTTSVTRSQAQVGDLVYVTGRLGGSFKSGRHLNFTPRVREALGLATLLRSDLHAMMDLSDGLGLDSDRMAHASGVCIDLDASRMPRHDGVGSWKQAAGEGEDYELLFTAPASSPMPQMCPGTTTPITCIGRVGASSESSPPGSSIITPEGSRVAGGTLGWSHT